MPSQVPPVCGQNSLQTRRCLCQADSRVHYYHSQLCDCLTRTTWPSQHLDTAWHYSSSSGNNKHNCTRQPHSGYRKSIPSYYVSDIEQTSERINKHLFIVYNTVFSISLHTRKYSQIRNTCVNSYNLKNSIKFTFFVQKRGLKITAWTVETCSPLPTTLGEEINDRC